MPQRTPGDMMARARVLINGQPVPLLVPVPMLVSMLWCVCHPVRSKSYSIFPNPITEMYLTESSIIKTTRSANDAH